MYTVFRDVTYVAYRNCTLTNVTERKKRRHWLGVLSRWGKHLALVN